MLKGKLLRKVMSMPFKKVGKSLTNIVVFDLAMSIYQFFKTKFLAVKHQEEKGEEVVNDDFLTGLKDKKRRW